MLESSLNRDSELNDSLCKYAKGFLNYITTTSSSCRLLRTTLINYDNLQVELLFNQIQRSECHRAARSSYEIRLSSSRMHFNKFLDLETLKKLSRALRPRFTFSNEFQLQIKCK